MAVSIRDAMLVYRTLSGNGSVLAFREDVFWRSAFATRCWFTALSVVMGLCWLSVRLFFSGQHSQMLVYRTLSGNGSVLAFCEAVFWRSAFATRCWFTALSVVMGQCWLSVRLFFGGQHSRRMETPVLVREQPQFVWETGVGAVDLIGSRTSGGLGKPLAGPRSPRGLGNS